MRKKLKVLLYGDVDLNIMDGSAVWLTSMANVLNYDKNIVVDVLLKARIKNRNLLSEIENLSQVNTIDTFNLFNKKFENGNRLNIFEAVKLMEELNEVNQYDCIIVRGYKLAIELMKSPLSSKIVPYFTEFTHNPDEITSEEKQVLQKIYSTFPKIFVQTNETKNLLNSILSVKGEKFCLLTPMIPDYGETPDFVNRNNSLVYTGKFAKGWYTEEILDAFKSVYEEDHSLVLNIAGDKFQGELIPEKDRIINRFNAESNVNWLGAIPRSESIKLVEESDVGVGWRSELIDNDTSVELSTKILEYGRQGKPVLLRRTKMYEDLLGKDYFLFVDNEEEFVRKTLEVMYNRNLYKKTAQTIYNACRYYTFKESYKRLKDMLWSFNNQKTKLLFAGHDLKFIDMALQYFKQNSKFEVKVDQWQGHNNHDEAYSKECLEWADVIFCEWGLGNAVWYSKHKSIDQKLIVRMHLQERVTEFPSQFHIENIDQIIAISPYIFEEFHRVNHIPRNKMTMIYNMVDTMKFDKPKLNKEEIQFNLGICGILPSRKRLDRALNIFEGLWNKDKRYKLFVKSRMPQELSWLMNRPQEKQYYDEVFDRIKKAPWGKNVVFDQHGNDMDKWFQKIGYVLSTSEYESFHLAPMEGMAAGSTPLLLHWPGAETIYPKEYLFNDEEEVITYVCNRKNYKQKIASKLKKYSQSEFDKSVIIKKIEEVILL
ncbi:group 1 glycosyl transferase [Priestia megaterium]|uniref:glycosyltransferase n=1 Tax=Priestia megaterium TaxID=1404 RepID=UPI0021D67430|nr:glycosyltransferase [Priestia megaterium]MCU7745558.1 group 1 glycosyl transferase [Priestia megaterium]